jgi:5-methylcytosine-specific restriction endonuclease McrA
MNDTNLTAVRESSRNLADLLRREHVALADFLVALSEFDRTGAYRRLGFANLFDYLLRELHLSRGAAHYRKVAARLVTRFPEVVEPLRDGRLCLTSIVQLAKVMTEANRAEVMPRFFHCSKQEAKEVAVEIMPAAVVPRRTVVTEIWPPVKSTTSPVHPGELPAAAPEPAPLPVREPVRTVVEPLTSTMSRLHLTVSRVFVGKLRKARAGQSHVQPDAEDEQVLEAALDLLLAQQERRRASVPPRVKREVRRRDEGKCQWKLDSGGVCGSEVRTEIDHVVPRGRGGPSTTANCRVLCEVHNGEAARQVYGDAHMDLFTRGVPHASEPMAEWGAGIPSSTRDLCAFPCGVTSSGPLPPFTQEAFESPTRHGERHDDPDPELDSLQRLQVPRLEGPLRGRLPGHRPRRLRRPDLLDSEALLRLAADGGGFRHRLHERLANPGGQPHGGR